MLNLVLIVVLCFRKSQRGSAAQLGREGELGGL